MKKIVETTYCDRCGEDYDSHSGRSITHMAWMVLTNGGGTQLSGMDKDLCPACTTGFLAWWNNARPTN